MNKLTKDDLTKMSDAGINKTICKLVTGYALPASACLDYCNNWNDIMPLAVEHGIGFSDNLGGNQKYVASDNMPDHFEYGWGLYFEDESPQRAIACCLILVLQERE